MNRHLRENFTFRFDKTKQVGGENHEMFDARSRNRLNAGVSGENPEMFSESSTKRLK